jgi:hypothetical protein
MRRVALRLFFASVGLNAALAIYALLAGAFGDTEGKILMTSLCVTGAVMLAIACEPAHERGQLGVLPRVGQAAAIAGFALVAASVWIEPERDWVGQTVGTLLVIACAIALLSLLALAALAPRFRWTFTATVALGATLTALAISAIWGQWDNEWFWRWFGVVAVALAAFTVVTPVIHRLSRKELAPQSLAESEGAPISFCPSCGAPLAAPSGTEVRCGTCGATFTVLMQPAVGSRP